MTNRTNRSKSDSLIEIFLGVQSSQQRIYIPNLLEKKHYKLKHINIHNLFLKVEKSNTLTFVENLYLNYNRIEVVVKYKI